MASTYSNLKIQLMATGENTGTWGNVTNDNLGVALEQAIVETATVTFASANVTLTLTDTNARQDARALRLNLAGTTGGARDLIVPAIQKPYLVNNGTADTITVKVSGQTGIAVPAGKSMLLYNNGTDVGLAFNRVVADVVGGNISGNGSGITAMNASEITTGSLANARTTASSSNGASTIVARDASGNFSANVITANGSSITGLNASNISAGTLGVANGGTGATTLNSEAVVIGNSTGAVKFVAPGTSGNVLTSNGTSWLSQAAAAGGGDYVMQVYTSPATWSKPGTIKAVKVTVIAGGGGAANSGNGGNGGSSSFGPFLSANGGSGAGFAGQGVATAGGTGSGGQLNTPGGPGISYQVGTDTTGASGGAGAFGFGAMNPNGTAAGRGYGGGGSVNGAGAGGGGGAIEYLDAPAIPGPVSVTVGGGGPGAGAGAAGVVIVEEFY